MLETLAFGEVEIDRATEAFRAGASGFISKSELSAHAIQRLVSGQSGDGRARRSS